MRVQLFFIFFFCFTQFTAQPSIASSEMDRAVINMQRDLQFIMRGEKELNKESYDAFWALLPNNFDRKEAADLLFGQLDNVVRFQVALWKNAQFCFELGEVVKSEAYIKEQKNMMEFAESVKPYDQGILNNFKKADEIFAAAANKTTFMTERGEIHISEELINSTLLNIETVLNRLTILMSPKWPQ